MNAYDELKDSIRNAPLALRRVYHLSQMSIDYIQDKGGWRQLTAKDKEHIIELLSERMFLLMCNGYREGQDPHRVLAANGEMLKAELREPAIAGAEQHWEDWLNDKYQPVFSADVK